MADILTFLEKIKKHRLSRAQLEIVIREAKKELVLQTKVDKLFAAKETDS